MTRTTSQVIIVGAGPTGLMLAAELALAGVSCRVLEKRGDAPNITRAFGVSARTLELLDARGLADEVLSRGYRVQSAQANVGVWLHFSRLDSRYNYMLIVPQSGTEAVLEKRCRDLGVPIERGATVVDVTQDADGVDVRIAGADGERQERAAYVVGCDGAHSAVRDAAGAAFVGDRYDVTLLLADVRLADPPHDLLFARANSAGIQLLIPFGDGFHRSISFRHGAPPTDRTPTLDEVRESSRRITGTDYGMSDLRWSTRFHSERKQAEHYRYGRVLLAGDAAHVHSPAGAQGMNTGIGDAMNLGWKLAATVRGTAPGWLLDSYEGERHRVGRQVLLITDRMFRLVMIKSAVVQRLVRFLQRVAFGIEAIQRMPRSFLSGLGIAYPGRGQRPHRLAGKRAPDIAIGGTAISEALRGGRFVLADTTPSGDAARIARERYADRVVPMTGKPTGRTPARPSTASPKAPSPAPSAAPPAGLPEVLLIRPDAYVAWAADSDDSGAATAAALAEWCGAPAPAS